MNRLKKMFSIGVALAGSATLAVLPSVDTVSFVVTNTPGAVVVDYAFSGAPAIITFEVKTNGVPLAIGYPSAVGAVNRFLQPGSYRFTWAADVDWPGHVISDPSVEIVVKAAATNDPPDYMLIPTDNDTLSRRYYDKAADIPGGITNHLYKSRYLPMRRIHAAGKTFRQGLMFPEPNRDTFNSGRLVAFSADYYIGVYELTVRQYRNLVPDNSTYPDWAEYCSNLRASLGEQLYAILMGDGEYNEARAVGGPTPRYYFLGNEASYIWPESQGAVRSTSATQKIRNATHIPQMYLPTSAQWEFACRAGSVTSFANGQTNIADLGWCTTNNAEDSDWVEGTPHAVGLLKPNAWGLYDMHGNVREWCCDCYAVTRTADAGGLPLVDPSGPASAGDPGSHVMVIHGGGYGDAEGKCSSGYVYGLSWNDGNRNDGFRLCCPVIVDR